MGIVKFLAARLDEDERIARGAIHRGGGRWRAGWDSAALTWDDRRGPSSGVGEVADQGGYSVVFGTPTDGQAIHIARHDPAHVLAEVAAKRAIIQLHPYRHSISDPDGLEIDDELCDRCDVDWPCPTLRAVVAIHADHPDFKPEWAL